MEDLKEKLAMEFEIKDLGSMRYFFGMKVAKNQKGIFISQRKYTLNLSNKFGIMGCKLTG